MAFVYGDSYGGVQSAALAKENADRSLAMQVLALQQQAMRDAWDRQFSVNQAEQSARERAATMAQNAAQFNANLQNAEEERALREDLGLMQFDQNQQRLKAGLDLAREKIAAANQRDSEIADSVGPNLASRFAELTSRNDAAKADVVKKGEEWLGLMKELSGYESQGLIQTKKNADKGVYEVTSLGKSDKSVADKVNYFNTHLRDVRAALEKADSDQKDVARQLEQHLRIITGNKFVPGPSGLVYGRTGQIFPFTNMPAQNSPVIRKFIRDPSGKLILQKP